MFQHDYGSLELEMVIKATIAGFLFEKANVCYVENKAEHMYAIVACVKLPISRSLGAFLACLSAMK